MKNKICAVVMSAIMLSEGLGAAFESACMVMKTVYDTVYKKVYVKETVPENGIYKTEDNRLFIDGEEYSMTFGDEFDGNGIDFTKWEYCPEWQRQGVNCYWRNNQVSVCNGNLMIEADYDGANYLMGGIRSKGKFQQTYGYFEARCTLNTVPGYWSAFWIMGESVSNENNSGLDGTEIDIMESAYFKKGINHGLHWDGYGANHKSVGQVTERDNLYDGNYHIFSLLWTEKEYVFYIDNEEVWRTFAEEAGGTCTVPLYLKFTTETSSWTWDSMDNSRLPDRVYLDYVRVYERKK